MITCCCSSTWADTAKYQVALNIQRASGREHGGTGLFCLVTSVKRKDLGRSGCYLSEQNLVAQLMFQAGP